MSPKKFILLIMGSMVIAALLLIPSINNKNPNSERKDGSSINVPTTRQLSTAKTTMLNVSVSLSGAQFYALEQLNQSFMTKYPNIKVMLSNTDPASGKSDVHNGWIELGQQRLNADILLLDNSWVKPFAVNGHLKPADRVIAGETQSDQLVRLIEPLKWNGYIWAVPRDANPYILLWNKSMLKEAGMEEPPKDWKNFLAASETIMGLYPDSKLINLSSGDLMQLIIWFESVAVLPANSAYTIDFGKEKLAELGWLEEMEAYIGRRSLYDSWQLSEDFEQDRTLAAVVSWDIYKRMDAALRDKLLVDRESMNYPWMNGSSFAISSNTRHEEEAAIWIKEMTGVEHQLEAYERFGLLPSRASLYSKSVYTDPALMPPEWAASALNESPAAGHEAANDPSWPSIWSEKERSWHLVTQDGIGDNPDFK